MEFLWGRSCCKQTIVWADCSPVYSWFFCLWFYICVFQVMPVLPYIRVSERRDKRQFLLEQFETQEWVATGKFFLLMQKELQGPFPPLKKSLLKGFSKITGWALMNHQHKREFHITTNILRCLILYLKESIPSAPILPSPSWSAAAKKVLVSELVNTLAPHSNLWRKYLGRKQLGFRFSHRSIFYGCRIVKQITISK